MKSCIFIAGIHGVGKTTFSNKLKTIINYPHYSASDLIKAFNSTLFFGNKRVSDVESNQHVLINSIEQNITEDCFILDGHFTLIKEDKSIENIPIQTFEKLNITKTILLLDQPNIIYDRINNREKKQLLSIEEIEKMQKEEIKYAKFVCFTKGIPLTILNNAFETDDFLKKEIIL